MSESTNKLDQLDKQNANLRKENKALRDQIRNNSNRSRFQGCNLSLFWWVVITTALSLALRYIFPELQGYGFWLFWVVVGVIVYLAYWILRTYGFVSSVCRNYPPSTWTFGPKGIWQWTTTILVLLLLFSLFSLGWGVFGPSSAQVEAWFAKLGKAWEEISPVGALLALAKEGAEEEGSSSGQGTTDDADVDDDILTILIKGGRLSGNPNSGYTNILQDGTKVRQNSGSKCFTLTPEFVPADCNPSLPWRVGTFKGVKYADGHVVE